MVSKTTGRGFEPRRKHHVARERPLFFGEKSVTDPLIRLLPAAVFPPSLRRKILAARAALLQWHVGHGRHDLPWSTRDPYGIWVSEIMMQQTQVKTGLTRYPRWMSAFPTVRDLARATEEEVVRQWEGLGYYARARNLHQAARRIVAEHGGALPASRAARLALPGVGPSTASAIGSFAFALREAVFDSNVERVWARWCGDRGPPLSASPSFRRRWLWSWAQLAMPHDSAAVRTWNQAMMDVGATVCTPRQPACSRCPLQSTCRAAALNAPERWPVSQKKPAIKEVAVWWHWRLENGRIAAVRRPTPGVWGGLWTPVEGPRFSEKDLAGAVRGVHRLSHRVVRWGLQRVVSLPEGGVTWLTRAEWEHRAWPRPLRRWWEGLSAAEKDRWWAPCVPASGPVK